MTNGTLAVGDPIGHIVVLMLENQSLDRVLGCMTAVNSDIDGVDPGHPGESDDPGGGQGYQQQPGASRTVANDLGHDLDDVQRQIRNVAVSLPIIQLSIHSRRGWYASR
jgi:hypothetical protein